MKPELACDQLVGRAFGEFVLRERIGEGGFGAVYRATQPALDRDAVVKVLHGRLHTSKAASERFMREAKLASKLDHPYSAHIYAFGVEPDGESWIAMELVRGTPLSELLKIQGPLSLERMVPLIDRICEVVQTAHEQGIVHRDLKPANVMVIARAGRLLPKLLDLGIAKAVAVADISIDDTIDPDADVDVTGATAAMAPVPVALGLTERGALIGSPPYMAPEQWLDAGEVDARTDLYALGVLVYESLTGALPFRGTTITAIATAHAKQPPPPVGDRLPAALDVFFAKALAKNAAGRYPDALAFAAAFREASGVAGDAANLPSLDPAHRDAAINAAPQPIAEAVAAVDAARNAHQARDAIVALARTVSRLLTLLALACRSRVAGGPESTELSDGLRALHRGTLPDARWLALGCAVARGWTERRDAFPVPELVDALTDRALVDDLEALVGLRERSTPSEAALRELLHDAVAGASRVLGAVAFLADYPLVVTVTSDVAERWTGVRRTQRTTIPVRGRRLAPGMPALLDASGAPVLSLAPLFHVVAPTPGAPLELFLFEGRDTRGARLVSLPAGFEHHDDAVWDWFRAQLVTTLDDTETAAAPQTSPYRGLTAFSAEDGAMFFGREKQVDAFVNRLKLAPLLAVVGRSGAGKSSFVHAGVVPALGWRAITMRPGPSPLGALVARLEHAGVGDELEVSASGRMATPVPFGGDLRETIASDRNALGAMLRKHAVVRGSVVLVVDQLEELFTLCQDPEERRVFAEAIASVVRATDDHVRVIVTLRDDFLVRSEQVPALRNRIGQGLQLLTVPSADDLERILVEPARHAGYEFDDPALPREMVAEVAEQPGALALLSFTAAKLWELRDRQFKQLTRAAYKTLGGVGGALARHADAMLAAMPAEERAIAREAFRHLVTTQNTRSVVVRKDLRKLIGDGDQADRVIEKLVDSRLLVASENERGAETIEIVHEALLSAWPQLVEWRRDDAEGARFREQLQVAAEQWHERGRSKDLLWRGNAFAELTLWRQRHPGPLTDLEAAFTTASEAATTRGRRIRRLLLASAFASLVAVVVGLVIFNAKVAGERTRAEGERARAEDARTRAEDAAHQLHDNLQRQYEDQGRRLVLSDDPLQALAYLAKATELGASGRARDFLIAQAVRASEGEQFEVRHGNAVRSVAFSHDGRLLVTSSHDHTARIWDARTGALLQTLHHGDVVVQARFSRDDRTVLTASWDGSAVVWDVATGSERHRLRHGGRVWCAVFSPDDMLAITAGEDDTVGVWQLADGALRFRVHGDGAGMRECAASSDGESLAAADPHGTIRLWSPRTGALLHELHDQRKLVRAISYAPDGRSLVAAIGGTAVVWDVATGERRQILHHRQDVVSAQFSPDGRWIATSSIDHTAALWEAASGQRRFEFTGHLGKVDRAVFSPDGKFVATVSEDTAVWLWDTSTGVVVARFRGHVDEVKDAAFDATGTHLATASDDGTAIVWAAEPHERVTWLRAKRPLAKTRWQYSTPPSFSPDGKRLVAIINDGTARVWDARSGREAAVLAGHDGALTAAAFGPDGRSVMTAGEDGTIQLWDADTASELKILDRAPGTVSAMAWSRDGAMMVAGGEGGWIRCLTVATGELRFANQGHGGAPIQSVAFDAAGMRIATAGGDLATRVWDLDGHLVAERHDTSQPLSVSFDPRGTRVLVAANTAKVWDPSDNSTVELVGPTPFLDANWAPDGAFAVTSGVDGVARVWDPKYGDNVGSLGHPSAVVRAAFSPDGERIAAELTDGTVAVHELPTHLPTASDLATILRCRVPFEILGDHIQPRARTERRGCDTR